MEVENHLTIKGASSSGYVFNVCLLDDGVHCVKKRFDGLPAVFVLAERNVCIDTGEVTYKYMYLGVTENLNDKLSDGVVDLMSKISYINCLCYIHVPDNLLRSDIAKDIAAANRFLYIEGLDGPQPFFGV